MTTATLWALLIGTLLPAATALATKLKASVKVKALVNAAFAAITGGLAGYLVTPPHGLGQWEQVLGSIMLAWLASGASILIGWKPTGGVAAIHRATEPFGLGRPTADASPLE